MSWGNSTVAACENAKDPALIGKEEKRKPGGGKGKIWKKKKGSSPGEFLLFINAGLREGVGALRGTRAAAS